MLSKSLRWLPCPSTASSRSLACSKSVVTSAAVARLPGRFNSRSKSTSTPLRLTSTPSLSTLPLRSASRAVTAASFLSPSWTPALYSCTLLHRHAPFAAPAPSGTATPAGIGNSAGSGGSGTGAPSRQVHVEHAIPEETQHEEYCAGPDQVVPARSHKCWSASDAVQLQMTESGPASDTPVSVFTFLQRVALQHPDHPALKVKRNGQWTTRTYREYFEESCIVAKAFIALGLDRFHGVCIMGFNSPEWFIANQGAIYAGGISVGIYPNNTGEASALVVEDCKAQILVVDNEETAGRLMSVRHKLTNVKAVVQWLGTPVAPGVMSWQDLVDLGQQQGDDELRQRLKLQAVNQCCSLIYTSGTTGAPKGVMCSQDSITWCASQYMHMFDLRMCEEWGISYLPLNHIAGQITDMYVAVPIAGTVYFANPDALKGSLIHTLKEVQPTGFLTVPRLLEKIQEQLISVTNQASPAKRAIMNWARRQSMNYYQSMINDRDPTAYEVACYKLAKSLVLDKLKLALGMSNVSTFVSGSAPLSDELVRFYLSLDLVVNNAYALSETHSNGTLCAIHKRRYRPGSVGQAVPFANMSIRKSSHTSGTIEGEGEIAFKGRNVFMGYLNSEEKTNETILDNGWLLTGDLGWKDKDGYFFVTGRAKELLVTAGGENIAPLPIEADIKTRLVPIIANAMLVGDSKKYLSILLTIKCERDPDTTAPLDALTESAVTWLRERGLEAKTVAKVREELANNPEGKVAQGIQEAIDGYNNESAISNIHKVRRWAVLPHDFSLPTGEVNNILKLKRRVVMEKYAPLIDSLYKLPKK